uniref:WD_REPEATS_REGION domain-containing protein n=1 Tax=Heterorhabditis bacteriophora TaxID=37862 RepID=A0A1I7XIS2_HETBA
MSSIAIVNGQPRDHAITPNKENQNPTSNNSTPHINNVTPQLQRDGRRSEIYRYNSPKPLYSAAWANKNDRRFRLAVGSIVELDQGNNENKYPDLIATSADFLRLWRIQPNNIVTEEAVLSSNKSSQFTAPLTNFDWNEVEPRLIGTSSIDTTCTIYDIETGQTAGVVRPTTFNVKTQLIAHDKPVHDIAFSRVYNGRDHFATVGITVDLKLKLIFIYWFYDSRKHLRKLGSCKRQVEFLLSLLRNRFIDLSSVLFIKIMLIKSFLGNIATIGIGYSVPNAHHNFVVQSQPTPQMMQTETFESMDAASAGPSSQDVNMGSVTRDEDKRKEIYGYDAPYTLFSSAWSAATDPQRRFRLAVSSFIEEYSNKVSIVQLDEDAGELILKNTFDHPYPATKLMWIPDSKGNYPDLIATSGDYLRLWRIGADNSAKIESLLNTNRTAEYCAPLTSFDWNELDLNLIGTSSIDTTCTVWQLEVFSLNSSHFFSAIVYLLLLQTGQAIGTTRSTVDGTVRTQLIAHDKEVFDISFSRGNRDVFASVGADGSVRLFDLRHLEHSTIIYEDPQRTPLLRLAWNRNDYNYIATFAMDSTEVIILDMRIPCTPVARLANHRAPVNGVSWAPHSNSHLCTAADDAQALIWDVHEMPRPVEDPILAYQAAGEVPFYSRQSVLTLCNIYMESMDKCLNDDEEKSCSSNPLLIFLRNHLHFFCGTYGPKLLENCKGIAEFYECVEGDLVNSCGELTAALLRRSLQEFGCMDEIKGTDMSRTDEVITKIIENNENPVNSIAIEEVLDNQSTTETLEDIFTKTTIESTTLPPCNVDDNMSITKCYSTLMGKLAGISVASPASTYMLFPLFNVTKDDVKSMCREYETANKCVGNLKDRCSRNQLLKFANVQFAIICASLSEVDFDQEYECLQEQILISKNCLLHINGTVQLNQARCKGHSAFTECIKDTITMKCGKGSTLLMNKIISGYRCHFKGNFKLNI